VGADRVGAGPPEHDQADVVVPSAQGRIQLADVQVHAATGQLGQGIGHEHHPHIVQLATSQTAGNNDVDPPS
jgi:hypothetical protein